MPPSQHRTPRETFTRALQRICRAIAEQPVIWGKWKDQQLGKEMRGTVRIENIWAVGSWAQGVSTCGDLDLVVQYVQKEGSPIPKDIMKQIIVKRAKNVRVYLGTPQENTSGIPFPNPKLMWSCDQDDWEKNIRAVKEVPSTTCQVRRTDDLPLRGEQVRMGWGEDLTLLLDLRDQGIISWEWIESDSLILSPSTWHPKTQRQWKILQRLSGASTGQALGMVLHWLESKGLNPEQDFPLLRLSSAEFIVDETFIRIGRPRASVEALNKKSCARLVLVPHRTRRGPNGLWVIKRGPNHPLQID